MKTLFIEPVSLPENGYCETFDFKVRDEVPAGEHFSPLDETRMLVEQ